MGFDLSKLGPGAFALRYFGKVTYLERCEALRRVGREIEQEKPVTKKLLVDFSYATSVEEQPGWGADFMAKVIAAPEIGNFVVAVVGTPHTDLLKAATQVCATRGITCRRFNSYSEALDWLRIDGHSAAPHGA